MATWTQRGPVRLRCGGSCDGDRTGRWAGHRIQLRVMIIDERSYEKSLTGRGGGGQLYSGDSGRRGGLGRLTRNLVRLKSCDGPRCHVSDRALALGFCRRECPRGESMDKSRGAEPVASATPLTQQGDVGLLGFDQPVDDVQPELGVVFPEDEVAAPVWSGVGGVRD